MCCVCDVRAMALCGRFVVAQARSHHRAHELAAVVALRCQHGAKGQSGAKAPVMTAVTSGMSTETSRYTALLAAVCARNPFGKVAVGRCHVNGDRMMDRSTDAAGIIRVRMGPIEAL